ncbi:MAG: conjugative transposon protein TraJ [Chitinophagaceae bacterium]|nr:conjugative transposon protein TraJ [Chitinophagaceae bacterium]MCA6448106.1 conjugative transposon protein TraJ [Chitinophagaceae bacterium]
MSNGVGLQFILDQLYKDMMPLCKGLIGAARLIGGFGALWYIAVRVWKNIAAAEPVDVYGLLRPFTLGFCILIFPSIIDLINGIMNPIVRATAAMQGDTNAALRAYIRMQESSNWDMGSINPMNWIREGFRILLELLFQTVALIIHVIRTFYLIVLAIIGPIVFALSIYDGFHHLITVWLARYVNVFLWLPVANIFGAIIAKIQENMVKDASFSVPIPGQPLTMTDWAYIAFLLIAIVGYSTVPSVTNYIVNAGGGNTLLHKVTSLSYGAAKKSVSTAMGGMASDAFGSGATKMGSGMSEAGVNQGYFADKVKGK